MVAIVGVLIEADRHPLGDAILTVPEGRKEILVTKIFRQWKHKANSVAPAAEVVCADVHAHPVRPGAVACGTRQE